MNLLKSNIPLKFVVIIITVLTFVLYGNTLKNQYCLDDSIVITKNAFTKQGFSGIDDIFKTESFTGFFGEQKELVAGARYRPLSIASFAVEYAILGDFNPKVSHFINLALYILTCLLLYILINKVFTKQTKYVQLVAFLTTLLFLFHPIHTEVIANIKGRDEILAFLFSLWASLLMLKYLEKGKGYLLFISAFIWFLALLSKENAFVFIVIMPVMLYLPAKQSIGALIKPVLAFMGAAVVFFIIRQSVIGNIVTIPSNELMNNSFLNSSENQRFATIFYTLGKYIQLLILPHPLTYDYYPYHISLVNWTSPYSIVSLFVYISLIILIAIYFRKNSFITISIILFIVPLIPVSNIFFPIGTFMNERFIYFSSLGYCLFFGYVCIGLLEKSKTQSWVLVLISVILFLYGFKTISRNTAWYSDYTLFTTDVKTSANSAKSNCSAGGVILERTDTVTDAYRKKVLLAESKKYLIKAVIIHPKYADALLLLGNAYFKDGGKYDSAVYYYNKILEDNPGNKLAIGNLIAAGNNSTDIDLKMSIFKTVLRYDNNNFEANYRLGILFGKIKNDIPNSIQYLEKAALLNPSSKEACLDLGVAYGFTGNYLKSAEWLEKAALIDPNDQNLYRNLGLTYQNLGKKIKQQNVLLKLKTLVLSNKFKLYGFYFCALQVWTID